MTTLATMVVGGLMAVPVLTMTANLYVYFSTHSWLQKYSHPGIKDKISNWIKFSQFGSIAFALGLFIHIASSQSSSEYDSTAESISATLFVMSFLASIFFEYKFTSQYATYQKHVLQASQETESVYSDGTHISLEYRETPKETGELPKKRSEAGTMA